MGRRRVKKGPNEPILTDDLVLRALATYSKPVPVVMVCRKICHLEKRLGDNYMIYAVDVKSLLEGLVKRGRVQFKVEEGPHVPTNPGFFATDCYWLGPLERLALQ